MVFFIICRIIYPINSTSYHWPVVKLKRVMEAPRLHIVDDLQYMKIKVARESEKPASDESNDKKIWDIDRHGESSGLLGGADEAT